ncbi:MAG: ABC transporter ATP-binding protein [Planctomycetes bacterium]|nr:ABC transporter ATP-binding protein [Planctomycetota bacterium]
MVVERLYTARDVTTQTTTSSTPAGGKASSPLLEIDDLAISFDVDAPERVQAVDGLTLTVHPRQTLALVGESGCGKSVTALSILGLLPCPPGRYDRGSIRFDGRDLQGLSKRELLAVRGGEIAMIFQEPMNSLNPVFTVGEQIIEAVRRHQRVTWRDARAIALEAMSEVGIARPEQGLSAHPHEFSGGMCQRVMTAMALACQPRLLLADEPTTALDVTIQAQILDLLGSLREQRGMSMMLITHDLGVVAQVADTVCVMYAGRALEYASVFDLFDEPLHPYTRGLFASIPRLRDRRRRLRTVKELIRDPAEFRKLPGIRYGIVPWWPAMNAPPDMAVPPTEGDSPVPCRLVEVAPNHWVSCWRTEYVENHPLTKPDLAARR